MAFELRVAGRAPARFDDERDAVAAARAMLRDDVNADIDLIDLATGQPCSPGAGGEWREDLWNSVGY